MASPLTQRALPAELADRRQVIETKEKIDSFPRLVEIIEADLADLEGTVGRPQWRRFPVAITLRFGWADERRELPSVEGRVDTRVISVCQRCLQPFELRLETVLKALLLEPQQGSAECGGYESWELEGERFRPIDIVEEALIMAMPMAPVHGPQATCRPLGVEWPEDDVEKVRPFAGLRTRMQDSE